MASVWAVTMVKDEVDVIGYTLSHLANEGVAGIIVADNMSSDGTRDLLEGLTLPCELKILEDTEVAYYQSRKMTALASSAFEFCGADWVIPFDADELWCSPGASLAAALGNIGPSVDAVAAQLYNHFPSVGQPMDPNPFKSVVMRDSKPAPLPKVAIRSTPQEFVIHQGNHGVSGRTAVKSRLQVHHFPWRSYEQFESKVRNGYKAYVATDLPEEIGGHWRSYGRVLEEHGPDALRGIYETWFTDPVDVRLIRDPAPYVGN